MNRRYIGFAAAGIFAASVLWPAGAWAHGLSARRDLPVPEWLFAWGASVVLAVSFVALTTLWHRPRLEVERRRRLLRLPAWLEPLCGVIGIGIFALVVYAGFAGVNSPNQNITPTLIFVLFWVGLAVLSGLIGDLFRPFNPWRAVARLGDRLRRSDRRRPYPERLGRYPAGAGLLAFAWLELVFERNEDTRILAALAVAYAALQLAGMWRYGTDTWGERGDAFGVYFGFFGRLAPLAVEDRELYARPPLSGLAGLRMIPGTQAVLFVMIGSTAFDGATNSDLWGSLGPSLSSLFEGLGLGTSAADQLAGTVGLAGSILLIAGVYEIGVAGMRGVSHAVAKPELARRFAHSLVPIALAYVIAHYFSLLVFQGQATAYLVSDPLGTGSDIFGTAGSKVDYAAVSATTIWYVQVVALVTGHVGGLLVAHDRALTTFANARDAMRSQYWMLAVMVGYTSLGLWLLSSVA